MIVPPVAFGLRRLAPAGRAVELRVLTEATERWLAAAPLLMLAPTQASAFAIAWYRAWRVCRPRLWFPCISALAIAESPSGRAIPLA